MGSLAIRDGQLYDLGEFSADYGIAKGPGLPSWLSGWDAYMSEHAFSALVIRFIDDGDRVVIGRITS